MKKWLTKLRRQFWRQPVANSIIIILILVGAWLRLHQLPATMMFQGDQGRDALVVASIWENLDPVFIGPVTSVGNMYLGPAYYYFMLPFLMFSYPSPIGPAIGVALVNILTIFLIYTLGQKIVGRKPALWAAAFFTFSQVAIFHARFSWNPNLSAPLSILMLYFLNQALNQNTKNWWWVGLIGGLLIQLHYINLILIAVAGLLWLYQTIKNKRIAGKDSGIAIGIFLLTLIPLTLFDLNHHWLNLQAARNIFGQENSFTLTQENSHFSFNNRLEQIITGMAFPALTNYQIGLIIAWIVTLGFFLLTYRRRDNKYFHGYLILSVSLIVSIIALSLYQHSVYAHYLLYLLPIILLIFGCLITVVTRSKFSWPLGIICFCLFCWGNYQAGFYRPVTPNLNDMNQITNTLLATLTPGETFNFVLLNDDQNALGENYRWFFHTKSDQLLSMDQSHNADVLFVIDELGNSDLYSNSNYALVVYRDLPGATLSAVPYDHPATKLYRFTRETESNNE